jgi:transcriptional regulator with XRE-family HTH domain
VTLAEQVAEQVIEARERLGLNRSELARRAGLTTAALWGIEHGERIPSAPSLLKLADALDVSTDWLLGRRGAEAPGDPRLARLVHGWARLSPRDRTAIVRLYEALAGEADE